MYWSIFLLRLAERCKSSQAEREGGPAFREGGLVFIESLTELLRRLLDYRTVQQGDEYRDLHMHVMFNLLVSLQLKCLALAYSVLLCQSLELSRWICFLL